MADQCNIAAAILTIAVDHGRVLLYYLLDLGSPKYFRTICLFVVYLWINIIKCTHVTRYSSLSVKEQSGDCSC